MICAMLLAFGKIALMMFDMHAFMILAISCDGTIYTICLHVDTPFWDIYLMLTG